MSAFARNALKILSDGSEPCAERAMLYATTALTEFCSAGADRWHDSRQHRSSATLLAPAIAAGLLCFANPSGAFAQDGAALPPIVVVDPAKKLKRMPAKRLASTRAVSSRGAGRNSQPVQEAAVTGAGAPTPVEAALDRKMQGFDQSRDHLLPRLGASTYTIDRAEILASPQGDNTPVDKLVLQLPGVNYDSAASNPNFHVRGEYANAGPSRGRLRSRPGDRHQLYWQPVAADRDLAGPVWRTHRGNPRHHQPDFFHAGR
jgi:hypothetical protein